MYLWCIVRGVKCPLPLPPFDHGRVIPDFAGEVKRKKFFGEKTFFLGRPFPPRSGRRWHGFCPTFPLQYIYTSRLALYSGNLTVEEEGFLFPFRVIPSEVIGRIHMRS